MAGGKLVRVVKGRKSRRANKKTTMRLINRVLTMKLEKKLFDVAAAGTSVDQTGTLIQLTAIPQGAAQGQRIGDRLKIKNINIQMVWDNPTTAATTMRAFLFRWKQNTASVAPSSGIWDATLYNTSGSTINKIGEDQRQYLTILRDVKKDSHNSSLNSNAIIRINKKMKSNLIFTTGGTTGFGHIYLYLFTDNIFANASGVSYHARITYTDA